MCQLLVGLPSVSVLGVVDLLPDVPLVVHVEAAPEGPEQCDGCGTRARVKDRDRVVLVDLPCFGRRARLLWRKRRWRCPRPKLRERAGPRPTRRSRRRGCG